MGSIIEKNRQKMLLVILSQIDRVYSIWMIEMKSTKKWTDARGPWNNNKLSKIFVIIILKEPQRNWADKYSNKSWLKTSQIWWKT